MPAGWSVKRLRFLAQVQTGIAKGKDVQGIETIRVPYLRVANVQDGFIDIDDVSEIEIAATDLGRYLLRAGDVLMNEGGDFDKLGRGQVWNGAIDPCIHQNHVFAVRPHGIEPEWLALVTSADCGRFFFMTRAKQSTNLASISSTNLLELPVPCPPPAERRAIMRFLDREAGKIDALVAEQERLIALLKQKRQAVISQAVTKGLDASVPMKDSGVAWLGQVPAHWEVLRLGALFREAIEEGEHDLPVLSVSIHDGVSDRELSDSEMDRKVTRSEDRTKYKKVAVGDLVYNMMRAWQGGFGTVAVAGMVSPAYVVARPRGDLRTAFVEFVLRTPQAIEEMRRYSKGVTDFRLRLYWDEFKQIVLAVPPLTEQASILAAIDDQAARFDTLTTEAHRAIALLRERRAALISAAVTGKIDVRGLCLSVDEAA
ncbi:Type-1 restriction enzyme EcoKI specificity protein [Roseomonas sp. CECT 9278]|nr:Type-1 restriction enzyme EcoKI specificity protein [Roseomonas sp. CECT 9278]